MIDKIYQPKALEERWTHFWEEKKYYRPLGSGKPYCIMLPPPNVTGTLHMGHGFQLSIMDALIRRKRMQGYRVLWQPGTDHASIATQIVVERQLLQEGLSRYDLGREKFLHRVEQWRQQSGSIITQQIHRLGASLDWEREHYSMDPVITKATYAAFIRLFEEGLIYRGQRLVNWDPQLHTAVSDLEVINEATPGHLWYIRYPLVNSKDKEYVIVATTRPETLFGDVAIAVHPDDVRYQSLIGKKVQLPLAEREIPIIGDSIVQPEFGTGCVKVTPAHDFNDYEIGKRHRLEMINIFTTSAQYNNNVPSDYQGLERFAARQRVIMDLQALGYLEKVENYTTNLPRGDRSGVILEPLLTNQWYVRMASFVPPATDAVQSKKLQFVPSSWTKTYLQWLEQIEDWCISRQLWWGHQIPVWYDGQHQSYVGYDENDVRQRYHLDSTVHLQQDQDVLDTWFTAALWPFSSLGWPDPTAELATFYPTNVLVTGFDIIFFWVARMVMMGIKFMGEVPFQEVYITGLIRDAHGQKMSKSKGNILDPIDLMDGIDLEFLIKKRTTGLMQPQMAPAIRQVTQDEFPQGIDAYGADALRFTFCALASTGRDIHFDMSRIGGYRNFCNKLWNAARFVLMNTEGEEEQLRSKNLEYSLADYWIQSELQNTISKVNVAFEQYRFDLIAQLVYEFTWNEYCDWYLELAKSAINNSSTNPEQKNAARQTLLEVLEVLLRLMHPLIPFITEEIWQKVVPRIQQGASESIMVAPYPESNPLFTPNVEAINAISWLKRVTYGIRNLRSEMNVAPGKNISLYFHHGSALDHQFLEQNEIYFKNLSKASQIVWVEEGMTIPSASAMVVIDQLEVYIPLTDLIDKKMELARIDKEINKLKQEQTKLQAKLNNPGYLAKAPLEVKEKEQQRYQQLLSSLEKLQTYHHKISAIE